VRSYFSKIAGPILDRIDIEVMLNRVPYRDLMEKGCAEPSEAIRERVMTAREAQARRFAGAVTVYNSRMTNQEAKQHCGLDNDSERLLESAIKKMNLSARSFFRILKVSRTRADLAGSPRIEKPHLLESLSYKSLHRLYAVR
jgi:magnesium chelatase family protein